MEAKAINGSHPYDVKEESSDEDSIQDPPPLGSQCDGYG